MLKIRMQRVGRTGMPAYRIVVAEHTASPKAGKFVEKVGSYNPKTKERSLDTERVKYWMSVGAQPSDTMHNMLVTMGVIKGGKINVLPKFVAKEVPAEEPAAAPVAAAAPAAETAPEEAPAVAQEAPADAGSEEAAA